MAQSSCFLDWMSYVIEDKIAEKKEQFQMVFIDAGLSARNIKRCKPRNAYKIAYQNEQGAIVMCSPCRVDMGINVLLTGSVLAKYDWLTVLCALTAIPGHFTRLDLTIDARDSGLDINRLYQMARKGLMTCKARKVTRLQSNTGTTLYVGSRSSERFMRIYDKAGEQGIEDTDWKRIELEASGQKAAWIGQYLAVSETASIPALIKDFIDFPSSRAWQGIFGGVVAQRTESDKKVSDTVAWLLDTVAPTLAKQIILDPNVEFDFQDRLLACIRELTETKKQAKLSFKAKLSGV